MDANDTTAANIRAALARRKMSGRQLAELLDKPPMWAQRRVAGDVPITVDDLQMIADALGVPLSTFLPVEKASA